MGNMIIPKNSYPKELMRSAFKDQDLWHRGNIDLLEWPKVSVIGSRAITSRGEQSTRRVVAWLVGNGYCVVSGLARGVDTVAHTMALEMNGATIAVMGTPIDGCYPQENVKLKAEIEGKGLVLSQFKIGLPISKGNFPKRNVLMGCLCEATVVIEAGEVSGTIYQVEAALKSGRKVGFLRSLAEQKYQWVEEALLNPLAFVVTAPNDLLYRLGLGQNLRFQGQGG